MTPTCRTSDTNLATYWHSRGLPFLEASFVEDPGRCCLTFLDPDNQERTLTRAFYGDVALQRFWDARQELLVAIHVARQSPERRCARAELEESLRQRRTRTYNRVRVQHRRRVD